jgi:MOSC domain-containing protein YiiM
VNRTPRGKPVIIAVNVSSGGIPKRAVEAATLTATGLAGDWHEHEKHRRPDRAVSIQDIEILDQLRAEGYPVGPGLMGENLTVKDLDVQSLTPGDRLFFDSGAALELTSVRKPCFVLDQIDPDLKTAVISRCGFMARVIEPGNLYAGQSIHVHRCPRRD